MALVSRCSGLGQLVAVGYGTSTTSVGKAVVGVQSGVGDERVGAGVAEAFVSLTVVVPPCPLLVEPEALFVPCAAAVRDRTEDGDTVAEALAEADGSGDALGDEALVAVGDLLASSGAESEPPPVEQPTPPSPSNATPVMPTSRRRRFTNPPQEIDQNRSKVLRRERWHPWAAVLALTVVTQSPSNTTLGLTPNTSSDNSPYLRHVSQPRQGTG